MAEGVGERKLGLGSSTDWTEEGWLDGIAEELLECVAHVIQLTTRALLTSHEALNRHLHECSDELSA
jgi:hypothetical protein